MLETPIQITLYNVIELRRIAHFWHVDFIVENR